MKRSLPDLILAQQKLAYEKTSFIAGHPSRPIHELEQKRDLAECISQTIDVLRWLEKNRAEVVGEAA